MKTIVLSVCFLLSLTGCSHSELTAPCPHYGNHCHKTPINSWDYPST